MKMKKKILIVVVIVLTTLSLSSCFGLSGFDSTAFLDGFDAGYNGYSLLGMKSSDSACSTACGNAGYKYYRYNYAKQLCYCK